LRVAASYLATRCRTALLESIQVEAKPRRCLFAQGKAAVHTVQSDFELWEILSNSRHNKLRGSGLGNSKDFSIKKGVTEKMQITRSLFGLVRRAAALSVLVTGTVSLANAQQTPSAQSNAPLFLAAESAPADLLSSTTAALYSSSASSSAAASAASASEALSLSSAALDSSQPPPRRRYGRPNYADSHSNPDGSSKYTFLGGIGLTLPVGDTHRYETPSYGFQFGGGRNWNKNFGVMLQFDYDHFGLQGSTLANQTTIYDYGCSAYYLSQGECGVSGLDGNNHVWSFTLNPVYTLSSGEGIGSYLVVGGGFYHKVTNFEEPTVQEECSLYGCGDYEVDSNIDHYTSNGLGVNGGFGLTYKFSKFSNEKFYMEARYVLMLNSQRTGVTAYNVATAPSTATDFYPGNSNRTTYIPIKFGIRF
jgi:hypothetical protein